MATATMTKREQADLTKKAAVGLAVVGGSVAALNRRLPTWARRGIGVGVGLIITGLVLDKGK